MLRILVLMVHSCGMNCTFSWMHFRLYFPRWTTLICFQSLLYILKWNNQISFFVSLLVHLTYFSDKNEASLRSKVCYGVVNVPCLGFPFKCVCSKNLRKGLLNVELLICYRGLRIVEVIETYLFIYVLIILFI